MVELYKDVLSAFFPILWDFERDSQNLVSVMKNALNTALNAPDLSDIEMVPQTEDAYYQAVDKYKLNGNFRKRLERFVDQASI